MVCTAPKLGEALSDTNKPPTCRVKNAEESMTLAEGKHATNPSTERSHPTPPILIPNQD